jgi:hypothetical protein
VSGVDDLFGGGEAAPAPPYRVPTPEQRLRSARRWLVAGAFLTAIGPFCLTGVPGAAALIWSFWTADEDVERARSGAIDPDHAEAATQLRRAATRGLGVACVLLLVQIVLFSIGVYEALIFGVLGALFGMAPPPVTP